MPLRACRAMGGEGHSLPRALHRHRRRILRRLDRQARAPMAPRRGEADADHAGGFGRYGGLGRIAGTRCTRPSALDVCAGRCLADWLRTPPMVPRRSWPRCALLAGLFAAALRSRRAARGPALVGLLGVGLALSLSGHAATADPRLLTSPSVFLHGICVAFWIGALLPLFAVLRGEARDRALARFSRAIPYPLAVLVITGVTLAVVQLDRLDALWTTRYGMVLACKLAAVAVLLALAAINRYALVPRSKPALAASPVRDRWSPRSPSSSQLRLSFLVWSRRGASRRRRVRSHWPVRTFPSTSMANVPWRRSKSCRCAAAVRMWIWKSSTASCARLRPRKSTLAFSRSGCGDRAGHAALAISEGGPQWAIDDLRIPIAGRWRLRVEILVDDFDKVVLEDDVELPRSP